MRGRGEAWVTAEGREIPIGKLTDNHLLNILRRGVRDSWSGRDGVVVRLLEEAYRRDFLRPRVTRPEDAQAFPPGTPIFTSRHVEAMPLLEVVVADRGLWLRCGGEMAEAVSPQPINRWAVQARNVVLGVDWGSRDGQAMVSTPTLDPTLDPSWLDPESGSDRRRREKREARQEARRLAEADRMREQLEELRERARKAGEAREDVAEAAASNPDFARELASLNASLARERDDLRRRLAELGQGVGPEPEVVVRDPVTGIAMRFRRPARGETQRETRAIGFTRPTRIIEVDE